MTFLKISIPVYKRDKWDTFCKEGKLVISSDVDNLSEGYQLLRLQIEELILELKAESRLAEQAYELERQIEQKAFELKGLLRDIERATEHYESLKFFLLSLGINPNSSRLTFDKKFLPQDASLSQVEVVSPDSIYPDDVI
jgi:hypothetical protein